MDGPIIPELQICSKNRIKTSVNKPQLDDTNVPITKTSHSILNNGEAKNHGEELFSVPISYGASEKQIQTLVPCPCDQRKTHHPSPHGLDCYAPPPAHAWISLWVRKQWVPSEV